MPGTGTSTAGVTNISKHGFWLMLDGRELFLSFQEFPWFKQGRSENVGQVLPRRRAITGPTTAA
jgi:hypothetical protein